MNSADDIWLVAVTAGKWQRHGIREARSAGFKVLAIDSDPEAEGFLEADKSLIIGFSDHAKVIEAVRSLGLNIKGVVSFCSEAGMEISANIREAFDLPGPRTELCHRLMDKSLQRKVWTDKGIPGPKWAEFQTVDAALKAIPVFGFPLIVKPADSSGSRGVAKLESMNDEIQDAVENAFLSSKNSNVLLEACMEGVEFTVETFSSSGNVEVLAVTEKKKIEATRGTVAKELASPDRSKEVVSRIANTVKDALLALGYTDGPGHAEVMLMGDGSVGLIEVAGRGGGFMVFDHFIPSVSGINVARLTALQAVGLPVGDIVKKEAAAVLRFFPARAGRLKKIFGLENANSINGVEAGSFVKEGEIFKMATTDGDRLGYILSCAHSPQEAQRLADEAESLIRFDFEEVE